LLITGHHQQLMIQLITQFEIRAKKACQLVMTKKEQVISKLEHGPLGIRNRKTEVAG
jgi:malate/lactate dehydrogenase